MKKNYNYWIFFLLGISIFSYSTLVYADSCSVEEFYFNRQNNEIVSRYKTYYYENFPTLEEALIYARPKHLEHNIIFDSTRKEYLVFNEIPDGICIQYSEN